MEPEPRSVDSGPAPAESTPPDLCRAPLELSLPVSFDFLPDSSSPLVVAYPRSYELPPSMLADDRIECFIVEFPRRADNLAHFICALRRANAELTLARPDLARHQLVQQDALTGIAQELRKMLALATDATVAVAAAHREAECAQMQIVQLKHRVEGLEEANLAQRPFRLLLDNIADGTPDALMAVAVKTQQQVEDLIQEATRVGREHAMKVSGLEESTRLLRAWAESLEGQLDLADLNMLSGMRSQTESPS